MALSISTHNIKSFAIEILVSTETSILDMPMMYVAQQTQNTAIKKYFKKMTVRDFLTQVYKMGGNIHHAYGQAMDSILTFLDKKEVILESIQERIVREKNAIKKEQPKEIVREVKKVEVLGGGNQPLFERILSATEGVIFYMKNCGYETTQRDGIMLEDYCFNTLSRSATAAKYGYTVERIRQIIENFTSNFLEGSTMSKTKGLYSIDSQLLTEISQLRSYLVGTPLSNHKEAIGSVTGKPLGFILQMFGCVVANIEGADYIVEKKYRLDYCYVAANAIRTLAKSVTAIPLTDLTTGLDAKMKRFLERLLEAAREIEITDGSVILRGKKLQKGVRQARIIYEAKGWISTEEIKRRYETMYGEPFKAPYPNVLKGLGCTNQNNLAFWIYGDIEVARLMDVIQTVLTPATPVATFQTILKAVRAKGLMYPEATVGAYITNIATPENKNHDLFCLKGHTHRYSSFSWRKYTKQPA